MNYVITRDDKYFKLIHNIDDYFVSLLLPKNLDGNSPNNVIIQYKRNYEELCVALMENGVSKPDTLSVMRFYMAVNYFYGKKKKNEAKRTNK